MATKFVDDKQCPCQFCSTPACVHFPVWSWQALLLHIATKSQMTSKSLIEDTGWYVKYTHLPLVAWAYDPSDFACIRGRNSKWVNTVQHAHASSISLSPSSAATSGLNEFLPIAAAQATHTHTNRMQSIGLSVELKAGICKHTLHCVTVAPNGTFYTWLWTVRQLLGTSLCILCLCCGQCLPEKKLEFDFHRWRLPCPFPFQEESWYHRFIFEVPFRQKAHHFPQCTQRKPSLAELRQSTNIQELVGSLANERLNLQFDRMHPITNHLLIFLLCNHPSSSINLPIFHDTNCAWITRGPATNSFAATTGTAIVRERQKN